MEISEEKLQEYCVKFSNNFSLGVYSLEKLKSIIKEILLDHEKNVRRQVIKELSQRKNKTVNHNTKRK